MVNMEARNNFRAPTDIVMTSLGCLRTYMKKQYSPILLKNSPNQGSSTETAIKCRSFRGFRQKSRMTCPKGSTNTSK